MDKILSVNAHEPIVLRGGRVSLDLLRYRNEWFDELVAKLHNGQALLDLITDTRESGQLEFDLLNHFDLLIQIEEIALTADETHAIFNYLSSTGEPGESRREIEWRRIWREWFQATLSIVLPPAADEPYLDPRMRPRSQEPYLAAEKRIFEFEAFAGYCSRLHRNNALRAVGERLVPMLREWRERGIYFFSYSAELKSEKVGQR